MPLSAVERNGRNNEKKQIPMERKWQPKTSHHRRHTPGDHPFGGGYQEVPYIF